MLRMPLFILGCLVSYGTLWMWLASSVDVESNRALYSAAHLGVAIVLNASLIYVLRKRRTSLLANPGAAFLLMSLVYFSLSSVRYFEPFPYFPMFNLDYTERFVGSMQGGAVLLLCICILALFPIQKVTDLNETIERHFPNLIRIFFVLIFVNVLMKLYLFSFDYGSAYTEGAVTANSTRNPLQLFAINGELYTSFVIATIAGIIWLVRPERFKVQPSLKIFALFMILFLPAYTIILLKGRLVALMYLFVYFFALQVRSQRWTIAAFQWLFCITPLLAVGTVTIATKALGRDFRDIGVEPSMSLNAGLVGWRTDLTDLGTAFVKASDGKPMDPGVITQGALNSVPATFWGRKDALLTDNYHESISALGWPAGLYGQRVVDYADNLFSIGPMAFGAIGFYVVFPLYIAFVTAMAVKLNRYRRYFVVLVPLLFLNVIFIRTEFEWQSMFLYFRDLLMYSLMFVILGFVAVRILIGTLVKRQVQEAV